MPIACAYDINATLQSHDIKQESEFPSLVTFSLGLHEKETQTAHAHYMGADGITTSTQSTSQVTST